MPIANNLIATAEVIVNGIITAGGSNSVPTQNVFHYTRANTVPVATKNNLYAIFETTMQAPMAAMLNNRWTWTTTTIRWLDDPTDAAAPFSPTAPPIVGGVAGDSLKSGTALFILFRSGLRGRSYRGGKHFGPMSEADCTAGGDDILNAAAITRANTLRTAMITTLVDALGNNWIPSIYSRKLSLPLLLPLASIVTFNVIVTLLNKRLGSMRGRQAKSLY